MCTSIVCTIVADMQEWDDDDGQRTANIHCERPAWALSCDGGPGGESVAAWSILGYAYNLEEYREPVEKSGTQYPGRPTAHKRRPPKLYSRTALSSASGC